MFDMNNISVFVILPKINYLVTCIILKNNFLFLFSQTIIVYLVKKYGGENNPLFPDDLKIQAKIMEKLLFNYGNLYLPFIEHYVNINIDLLTSNISNIVINSSLSFDVIVYSPIDIKWWYQVQGIYLLFSFAFARTLNTMS